MRHEFVIGAHGWTFTNFWWEGGYCRFYGQQPLNKCLAMARGDYPWPMLPPDPNPQKRV